MNKTPVKNQISDKQKTKDRYTAVLVSQIIAVVILLLVFNLTVRNSQSVYSEFRNIINKELFTIGDVAETIRHYFSGDNVWAVSGNSVISESDITTEITSEKAVSETAMGGEDLALYEAADNTSFAPFKVTSPSVFPVKNGRYTSYFGYRVNPITGEFSFHTGLDIAADEGAKIRAVYSGRVLKSGEDERTGKYIYLLHDDGLVTFYCHCSEITAECGAVIRQGETIAKVGSTGWSTGPHLHFEIRKNDIRYNPLYILDYDSDC